MNEAELLLIASEALDRMWALLQWWASISFGLLVVAYIAPDRVGIYLAGLISVLYTLFSIGVGGIAQRNLGIVESVYEDLRILQDGGVELTMTAKYMISDDGIVTSLALPLAVALTYGGILGYFIYSYRKTQRIDSK